MQARKAQDFHAGSKILSGLTKSALKEAKDISKNCEVIFPNENIESMPNRFMAIVESDDIQKFGEELKKHVEDCFKDQVNEAFKDVFNNKYPSGYEFQRDNFLSITWAAFDYEGNNYQQNYKELESILGGVKNIREFNQLPDTEKGKKCSICGERNAIIFDDKVPSKKAHLMKPGEGLCAICGFKRFTKDTDSYKSTSDIALLHTMKELGIKLGRKIDNKSYEPQILVMAEKDVVNNKKNIEEQINKIEKDKSFDKTPTDKIRKTLEILKLIVENKIKRTRYYALIAFDGDSMGETLGGGKLKIGEDLKKFQQDLSKHLGDFAKAVCNEIKEDEGQVVFAGGEDFLGFVNLESLFSVMERLRTLFDTEVHNKLADRLENGKKLSFSAGVVVAHVKTPLGNVIGMSREMEKKAKEKERKDAFAIAVMKHSGEINQAIFNWRDKENKFITDAMNNLVKNLKSDEISNTFMKFLEKEFSPIMSKEGVVEISAVKNELFKEMFQSELNRTLKRSIQKGNAEEKAEKRKEIAPLVEAMIKNSTETTGTTGVEEIRISNLFNAFHIIDFMAREAGGKDEN
jgi:CRISPR-associated protein Cmr2